MKKRSAKILFISPEPILDNFSGSSNRIFQTYNLLKTNFIYVDYLSIGPNKNCNLHTSFPKNTVSIKKIQIPSNYDIYFINYIFLFEQLIIPKNKKIYIDLHDDIIDRNKKLGSNWITRDYASLKKIVHESINFIHISRFEQQLYNKLFPKNNNLLLSFLNSERGKKKFKVEHQFEFGFVGTQNFVNANSIIKIVEFSDKLKSNKKFLIVGNIIHGIKNPPKNFTLLDHLKNINDFYKSIKYLIVPNPNQTGVSTKIIESLNYNCPVLTTSSMTKMLNIDLYDIEINNINDLATYYKGLNYEFILKKQIHAFENYKSTVKKEEKEIINHLNNSSIYNSS